MAITRPGTGPEAGPQLIGQALRDLSGHPDHRDMLTGASINLSQPLPLYGLGLDDIDGPHSIEKAFQFGWRYLIEHGDSGGASYADVRKAKNGEFKFTGLSRNANADRLTKAAHLAEKVGNAPGVDYEARILEVPSVYMSAIWLAGPTPVFIPYIDPATFSDPDTEVRVQPEFLENLARAAAEAKRHLSEGPSQPLPAPF
jgi:hypothetical protein